MAEDKTKKPPKSSPTLTRLGALVGEWDIEISFPRNQSAIVRGHASFEWLEDGAFLLMHSDAENPETPRAVAVIGFDDSARTYHMLYFDSRDISRIYEMSLNDGVWRMWRESSDFSQHFTGTFSEDGDTITAQWEKSSDYSNWEHDFDLTYTRVT